MASFIFSLSKQRFISQPFGLTQFLVVATLAFAMITHASAVTQDQVNKSAREIKRLQTGISDLEQSIKSQEQSLWSQDKKILDLRKVVRDERTASQKLYHEANREFKRQAFEIERIEKDLSLVEFDIEIVRRDMDRDQQRFNALNVLKQRLGESDFQKREQEYQSQIRALETRTSPLVKELQRAKNKLAELQSQLDSQKEVVDDNALDADPRIAALSRKREAAAVKLTEQREALKSLQSSLSNETTRFNRLATQLKRDKDAKTNAQVTAPVSAPKPQQSNKDTASNKDAGPFHSYVFVISGDQEPNIEDTLRLRGWVESYGAKYIEASWNGFTANKGPSSNDGFQAAFKEYIRQIPKDAKLVLIGHGLGGGAAIEAATKIAFNEKRTIDFLAVLDPMGAEGLRANIVYDTKDTCIKPDPNDTISNAVTNAEYIACIKSSNKRQITSNIKHFYNRWQKDAQGPFDFQRQIPSLNSAGKVVNVPTASGRFDIQGETESDQRRMFFAGDKNAHKLLLAEEAKVLPKLLVPYLR